MWEKVTTIILITTYTFSVLFFFCILLEKILTTILDIDLQPPLGISILSNYFSATKNSSFQRYGRTINPINLRIPIKEVFYAFLNRVKEYNLAPKNPNALKRIERYKHNFEVEDIERKITTQKILIIGYKQIYYEYEISYITILKI